MEEQDRSDNIIDSFLAMLVHPLFNLFVGCILAILAATEIVNITVAICAFLAWLAASLGIARTKYVKKLPIGKKFVILIGIATIFAGGLYLFSTLALKHYQQKQITQKPPHNETPEKPAMTAIPETKKPENPPKKKEPKGIESGQQKTLENIETMMKYENTPKFQVEDVNISDKHISDANIKWPSRLFVYNAVLHNVGTRVLSVSGIYFCVLKPDEKGCPRSYHIASEFMLEPGGKWPFSFDTNQWFKSDPVLELENIELFLQIEYINPDRSTSVFQKWITGFRGGGVVMHMTLKAPR